MAKVITLDGRLDRQTRGDVLKRELEQAHMAFRIERDRKCLDNCSNELNRFWKQHDKAKQVCRDEGWGSDRCKVARDSAEHTLGQALRMSKSKRKRRSRKDRYPKGTVFAGKRRKKR